jgi:hypothetical protein
MVIILNFNKMPNTYSYNDNINDNIIDIIDNNPTYYIKYISEQLDNPDIYNSVLKFYKILKMTENNKSIEYIYPSCINPYMNYYMKQMKKKFINEGCFNFRDIKHMKKVLISTYN